MSLLSPWEKLDKEGELCAHLERGAPGGERLPAVEVDQAGEGGVVEAPGRVHGLVVAQQHRQAPARARGLPLQPLQKVQDLQLVVPPVQLVPHLQQACAVPAACAYFASMSRPFAILSLFCASISSSCQSCKQEKS